MKNDDLGKGKGCEVEVEVCCDFVKHLLVMFISAFFLFLFRELQMFGQELK